MSEVPLYVTARGEVFSVNPHSNCHTLTGNPNTHSGYISARLTAFVGEFNLKNVGASRALVVAVSAGAASRSLSSRSMGSYR